MGNKELGKSHQHKGEKHYEILQNNCCLYPLIVKVFNIYENPIHFVKRYIPKVGVCVVTKNAKKSKNTAGN